MAEYKICVGFENNCEKVLKRLFQYRYRWDISDDQKIIDHPYIYFDDDNTVQYGDHYQFFKDDPSKEISIPEFFEMFPKKVVEEENTNKYKIDIYNNDGTLFKEIKVDNYDYGGEVLVTIEGDEKYRYYGFNYVIVESNK